MKHFNSLKNKNEFGYVYRCGKSLANKYLVMYVVENQGKDSRIGISVSKKVGNSVVRHRITRLIRESFRLHQQDVQGGYDIVVVARTTSKDCNYWDVESAFMHLIRIHHILKEDENNA